MTASAAVLPANEFNATHIRLGCQGWSGMPGAYPCDELPDRPRGPKDVRRGRPE